MSYENLIKMKKQIYLMLVIMILVIEAYSDETSRPFPQNIDYSFGFKPNTINYTEAQNTYIHWKDLLLVECNNGYRVICEGQDETRVEAIGFGMLLTAYYGDKDEFDGLYHFYKSKRTSNAKNMMAWNVSCDEINDPGSATDGDIDVAFSLIVAYNQWGDNYLKEAKSVIQVIKNSVVITCDSLLAIAPGYSEESEGLWGGCNLTDIQYNTPAFF